jgi:hypothetical protein
VVRRLLTELRRRPTHAEVEGALASLTVVVESGVAVIARAGGSLLFGSTSRAERVSIGPSIYTTTPTSHARIRLLQAAARIAPRVDVHAPTASIGSFRGRIAIDLPRRAARALGLDAAEPGDRFDGTFAHAFFDDEAIVEEARAAGLAFLRRRGAVVELAGGIDTPLEQAEPFASELLRAVRTVRDAERLRLHDSPARAVERMRERGRKHARRGPIGRARLRRAIAWLDAGFVRGGNCFRRTLSEIGLDAGAAEEPLVFGLDVGRTGHVALKDSEEARFDVAFEIPL